MLAWIVVGPSEMKGMMKESGGQGGDGCKERRQREG